MPIKAYLSNISPRWPIQRQEEVLRGAIPGWPKGITIFRDVLDLNQRRAHRKNDLVERAALLRGTSRGSEIVMATLAAWDWSAEGMLAAITLALSRGDVIRVVDGDLRLQPGASAADLVGVTAAFEASRKIDKAILRGSPGGKVSAEKRAAEARRRALEVMPLWRLPSSEWPQAAVAIKANLSLNTLKLYLPPRKEAQHDYKVEQSRLKKRAARAAKENT